MEDAQKKLDKDLKKEEKEEEEEDMIKFLLPARYGSDITEVFG